MGYGATIRDLSDEALGEEAVGGGEDECNYVWESRGYVRGEGVG